MSPSMVGPDDGDEKKSRHDTGSNDDDDEDDLGKKYADPGPGPGPDDDDEDDAGLISEHHYRKPNMNYLTKIF